MDPTAQGAGENAGAPLNNTIKLGPTEYVIEPVSARKASRAFAIIRRVGKVVEAIAEDLAQFDQNYGTTHYVEFTPAQARMRYPKRPLLGDDRLPIYEPAVLVIEGEERPNPRAGELVYLASPVDAITEEDWAASGGVLRLPVEPEDYERFAAVFDKATEEAEADVYELLALFTFSNADVKAFRRDGTLADKLRDRAEDLLDDALADEVLELAVMAGEVVDDQFRRKAATLGGGRLGKALSLLGINPTQEATQTPGQEEQTDQTATDPDPAGSSPSPTSETSPAPSASSTPTSPTDSPAPTAGAPTPPSTPTTPSSSPSEPASTETEPTLA